MSHDGWRAESSKLKLLGTCKRAIDMAKNPEIELYSRDVPLSLQSCQQVTPGKLKIFGQYADNCVTCYNAPAVTLLNGILHPTLGSPTAAATPELPAVPFSPFETAAPGHQASPLAWDFTGNNMSSTPVFRGRGCSYYLYYFARPKPAWRPQALEGCLSLW